MPSYMDQVRCMSSDDLYNYSLTPLEQNLDLVFDELRSLPIYRLITLLRQETWIPGYEIDKLEEALRKEADRREEDERVSAAYGQADWERTCAKEAELY